MCFQTWSEVLREKFGNRIECVYAKGSAVKAWDSPIDYVPVLSDADIHVLLKDEEEFLDDEEDVFAQAMAMSHAYERRFFEMNPEPLHFPRSQIVHTNRFKLSHRYTPPKSGEVQELVGSLKQEALPSDEQIRKWDYENLIELEDFLRAVPMSAVDRAGFDFWTLIRRMVFRVSPSPFRLLTQDSDDPYEVWSWNRSRISRELEGEYPNIEAHYRGFYEAGWHLFLSDFSSRDAFREVTTHGYYVLKGCYDKTMERIS